MDAPAARGLKLRKLTAVGSLCAVAFWAGACGTTDPETGGDGGDIQGGDVVQTAVPDAEADGPAESYVGPYDANFSNEALTHAGKDVTLSALVNEAISPTAFTIAGADDTEVDELLIISEERDTALEPGQVVHVTGTVQKAFQRPRAEEVSENVDEEAFSDHYGEPYLEATAVSTDRPAEG